MKKTMYHTRTIARQFLHKQIARLSIFALFSVFAIGVWQACLPGPTSLQLQNIINCGDLSSNLNRGIIDVGVVDTYYMRMRLINMLAITANPAHFIAEVNFIDLKEAKIWFEYPKDFSLLGSGSPFLYTQQNPYIIRMNQTLSPSLQGDFQGTAGGAGGTAPEGQEVDFEMISSATTKVWVLAAELKDNTKVNTDAERHTTPSFSVIANITVSGITRAGHVISTPEITFPIRVCKECLNKTKNKNSPDCSSSGGTGGSGRNCEGQDGICFGDSKQGN